ncbi:MAG TPA: hypothetical protein VFE90_24410 [Myxococcales bacterium]|jgi:hypothetical protein|nr:hypothetical protein [Myxococcales bacterium]
MQHAAATAPALAAAGRQPRRLRNYLLDAPLQLRLASWLLAASAALSLGLGFLLFRAWQETSRVIALGDPEGSAIALALAREDRSRVVLVAVVLACALVCLSGSAVVLSHRIAGPAFALGRICRQVGEGKLAPARPLRPRDLLVGLGKEVAAMVDALREREARERAAVLAAASALRDPAAGAEARTAAAEELEGLARQKGERLAS